MKGVTTLVSDEKFIHEAYELAKDGSEVYARQSVMVTGQYILIVYALLILLGGVFGGRAGSKASVIAGTASGALLLAALVVSWFHLAAGLWAGAAISLLLAVTFGRRLAKTGKFMPSGMLLGLSIVAALVLVFSALGA